MKNEEVFYKLKQMKKIYLLLIIVTYASCKQKQDSSKKTTINPAKELISKMVDKVGSYEQLKKLKNVEFNYTFHQPKSNKEDISVERYVFEGKASWGKYSKHQIFVSPKTKDEIVQYSDEKQTWVEIDKKRVETNKAIQNAKFVRKANFYWFTMMQKLLDKGLIYKLLPDRTLNGVNYKIIKIGFEKNIGDYQDDFILYLNPKTYLIDQFIFTVKGSNITEPMLMKVNYEKVNGILIMAKRDIYLSDWDGNIKGDILFQQLTENIKFNTNFDNSMFEKK